MAEDRDWNSKYLVDAGTGRAMPPVTTPSKPRGEPNQSESQRRKSVSKASVDAAASSGIYPSPPSSASSRRHQSPQSLSKTPENPFRNNDDARQRQENGPPPSVTPPRTERRRATSLSSRFPGDRSHQPLDMIRRESKRAHRAPHLRREHLPGPDTIDRLDNVAVGGAYHHEGPYDAALLARNRSLKISPLEAVRWTNEEALKATPSANLKDSLERHRPLDGVAYLAPGMTDLSGQRMEYEEGSNMMVDAGGNYKRWPGVEYHPDDIKGKGEPSFSIDRSLKQSQSSGHRRLLSDPEGVYEMTARDRPSSAGQSDGADAHEPFDDGYGNVRRRHTTGRSAGGSLRKRLVSFGRKG